MKILIGGSPCTHWSIAQTKHRETEASGIGWELFLNYRIARDKYLPDYFLYENNKSMSPAIRAQITAELGVEPVLINSTLVSAQNRQRLYWVGRRNPDGTYSQVDVEQPADRGILLRDILETGIPWQERAYNLTTRCCGAIPSDTLKRHRHTMVAEPVLINTEAGYALRPEVAEVLNVNPSGHGINGAVIHCDGKSRTLTTNKGEGPKVIVPVQIGTIENDARNQDFDGQQYRVYSPDGKGVTLCGNGGGLGAKTGLYATPVRVGDMPNAEGVIRGGQAHRVYDSDGKAVTLTARPNGGGVDGPLYAVLAGMTWRGREDGSKFEMRDDQKSNAVAATGHQSRLAIEAADGKQLPVYEVRNGQITIKGKQYPIKLADGFYIIRELTVTECKRLQAVPDTYAFPVSDTQAYKMLGNGWTVDVIAHIMSHFDGLTTEPVEVLSMYDGMSCGHIALDKLGAEIAAYYATEIDKYAIQTTQHNFPTTVQLGDAFRVRSEDWHLPGMEAAGNG